MKLNLKENFKHIFAILITFSTFAFDMMLFFTKAPAENRDTINMIAGVLNTGCLITVVNYFYSSTANSTERMKEIIAMKKAEQNGNNEKPQA